MIVKIFAFWASVLFVLLRNTRIDIFISKAMKIFLLSHHVDIDEYIQNIYLTISNDFID